MLDIRKDMCSLGEFKRKPTSFLKRMRDSGHPLVLTVNGKAEMVVQDAVSYQKLLDHLDEIETLQGIKRGLSVSCVPCGQDRSSQITARGVARD